MSEGLFGMQVEPNVDMPMRDGVLLPPRLDDAELLRFLQATRPPLQARAAVEAVADDIRWRATRGGGAPRPLGAARAVGGPPPPSRPPPPPLSTPPAPPPARPPEN